MMAIAIAVAKKVITSVCDHLFFLNYFVFFACLLDKPQIKMHRIFLCLKKKTLDLELTPRCIVALSEVKSMTIKEVCEKYNLTADTLRYYERVGVIPEVTRTAGGIRDYEETDLAWAENAVCMRDAGVPVEMLIEYVKLFQEGDSTIDARTNLLKEAREQILETKKKYDVALEKLNYKIGRYEIAQKTGKLTWEDA